MGRYYNGDIEGKFWFAVQSSDCADRFGSIGEQPQRIEYWFDEEHLPKIRAELKSIEDNDGDGIEVIENFFKENNGWNDDMLMKYFEKEGKIRDGFFKGQHTKEGKMKLIKHFLSEYADYKLGKKILKCVLDTGSCQFEGEC